MSRHIRTSGKRGKMFEQFGNLTIRNATIQDADLLSAWWNDGKIMAHAGFPNGTGETAKCIAEKISKDEDTIRRRLIVEYDKIPIGEMSYYNVGNNTAESSTLRTIHQKNKHNGGKIYHDFKINQGCGRISGANHTDAG